MTTLADLRALVGRAIKDPEHTVFEVDTLDDLINLAISEVSEFMPQAYVEDIVPTIGQYRYALISGSAPEGVEITRVELWDATVTPSKAVSRFNAVAGEYVNSGETGYEVRQGYLWLPSRIASQLDPDKYVIRVWGWKPYVQLSSPANETDLTIQAQWAVRDRVKVEAFEQLIASRALFKQWQEQTQNTDTTLSQLMNELGAARQTWERRRKQLTVMR